MQMLETCNKYWKARDQVTENIPLARTRVAHPRWPSMCVMTIRIYPDAQLVANWLNGYPKRSNHYNEPPAPNTQMAIKNIPTLIGNYEGVESYFFNIPEVAPTSDQTSSTLSLLYPIDTKLNNRTES